MKPRSVRSMIWRFTPARSTCAPIMRMRAAPRWRACTMQPARSGNCGCAYGSAISSRGSQWLASRSFTRSARGFTCSRMRSNTAYLLAIREERVQQFVAAKEIGDDEIRAHARQAQALPFIHGAAFRLRRGHADRDTAHLFDVLDFDIAVAEAQEFCSLELRRCDQSLNQDFLREALVVVERAVHPAVEVARHIQQAGFFAHVLLVGAAGQV